MLNVVNIRHLLPPINRQIFIVPVFRRTLDINVRIYSVRRKKEIDLSDKKKSWGVSLSTYLDVDILQINVEAPVDLRPDLIKESNVVKPQQQLSVAKLRRKQTSRFKPVSLIAANNSPYNCCRWALYFAGRRFIFRPDGPTNCSRSFC